MYKFTLKKSFTRYLCSVTETSMGRMYFLEIGAVISSLPHVLLNMWLGPSLHGEVASVFPWIQALQGKWCYVTLEARLSKGNTASSWFSWDTCLWIPGHSDKSLKALKLPWERKPWLAQVGRPYEETPPPQVKPHEGRDT